MSPLRRRPGPGDSVHVRLTRLELRRLTQRGIHLPLRPSEPRPPEPPGGAPERLLELERAVALAQAEARSLATKLQHLAAERAAESAERAELGDELLDRERRIAELHSQIVYWQHHARRAQAAVRYASGPLRAAVGAQAAPAPSTFPPEPAERSLSLTTPLPPLPARVLAEVRTSLEQTAIDPRPWLSTGRLSRRARERWIGGLAVLAIVVPVVAMTSGSSPDAGARATPPAAAVAELERQPLPDARLPHAVAAVLAELLTPRLRAVEAEPRPAPRPAAARATRVAASPGEPGSGRALAGFVSWHLRATREAIGRSARAAAPPPSGLAPAASALPAAGAIRGASAAREPLAPPPTPLVLPAPPAPAFLEASVTQRRVLAEACRADRGARLARTGWAWPLPAAPSAPEWLIAFPVLGGDLEVGPIGLWWWRGDRHDPESDVRAVNELARAISDRPGGLAPRGPGAVEGAEVLVLWTGIAQRLEPERAALDGLPLFRASSESTVAVVRPGLRSDAAWRELARRVLSARGRAAGTVDFAAVAGEADGRGWVERPLARVTIGPDEHAVSILRSEAGTRAPGGH